MDSLRELLIPQENEPTYLLKSTEAAKAIAFTMRRPGPVNGTWNFGKETLPAKDELTERFILTYRKYPFVANLVMNQVGGGS